MKSKNTSDDHLKYKYILEISYKAKDKIETSILCHKIAHYLDLEFGLKIEKKSENSKCFFIFINEDFDEEAVSEYIISHINPDNYSIVKNAAEGNE